MKLNLLQEYLDREESQHMLIQNVNEIITDYSKWDELDIAKLGVMAELPESLLECFSPQGKRVYEMVKPSLQPVKSSAEQKGENGNGGASASSNNTRKQGRKMLSQRLLVGPRTATRKQKPLRAEKPPPGGLPSALAQMVETMHGRLTAVNAIKTAGWHSELVNDIGTDVGDRISLPSSTAPYKKAEPSSHHKMMRMDSNSNAQRIADAASVQVRVLLDRVLLDGVLLDRLYF